MHLKKKEKSKDLEIRGDKKFLPVGKTRAVRRKIALFHCIGMRNSVIAKRLGLSSSTVSRWLEEPKTQEVVATIEQDIFSSVERKYKLLMLHAVDRVGNIIKHSGDDIALSAIEMVFKMDGRIQDAKQRSTMDDILQGGGMVGAFSLPSDRVEGAMEYLNKTRLISKGRAVVEDDGEVDK